jgi:aspartate aminotransferase
MVKFFPGNVEVYLPTPSRSNDTLIFKHSGLSVQQMTCGFEIQGVVQDIPNVSEQSVILFHAYAHNSTGVDPKQLWIEISKVFQQKKLFPFFDIAYQGFASGVVARDAFTVRHFVKNSVLCLAMSTQHTSRTSSRLNLFGSQRS